MATRTARPVLCAIFPDGPAQPLRLAPGCHADRDERALCRRDFPAFRAILGKKQEGRMRQGMWRWGLALVAVLAALLAVIALERARGDVTVDAANFGTVPARIYHPAQAAAGPVVVIAHGFAGSQQLMQSFAFSLARSGHVAVTYDLAGHGRNPTALSGSVVEVEGATARLLAELQGVMAAAKPLGDGRIVLLGHSMASDIVVRAGLADPSVAATIAVSMFSPAVTATGPRNLLVITGEWEGVLSAEALRVVQLLQPDAVAGQTYGPPENRRRAVVAPHVEHASVLFSSAAMAETVAWVDALSPAGHPPQVADRGGWIVLLVMAMVALAAPAFRLLPRLCPPQGAGLNGTQVWIVALLPMIAVPLLLRVVPTKFLPVLVADYLALHFLVYGVMTALCLRAVGARRPTLPRGLPAAGALAVVYVALALFLPVDRYLTNFWPTGARAVIIAAMALGTLPFFLALEWAGKAGPRGGSLLLKLAFLLSLGLAVTLDFERLFFLLIILPVVVLFLLVFGLLSGFAWRRTGHPFVGAVMCAAAFAWALGVTFPLLSAG